MTAAAVAPRLVGRQTPTFLWVPPHEDSYGQEVIDLAASGGLVLDPWQQLLVRHACSVGSAGAWSCFEVGIIVSRQNGKGSFLEAMELAWLFLFGEELVLHSAHLFETSREHFLRMQALIGNYDGFSRRVRRMREGRGSEEIELMGGGRLKFMTRKGGAGRGFTGSKIVLDEAMYLDAAMMAAALPTLATVPNAQVIYTGSAGMKQSTQLADVRRRGYARDDPALMFAEWAAEEPRYDPQGELVAGDDPESPQTWAKTNPGLGIRITPGYIRKEMRALGGPRSPQFWGERLGIGDYPAEDAAWEVIDQASWEARADPSSQIVEGSGIALAVDADPDRAMGTIGVCGVRADGRDHIEVVERHRGTGWITDATTGEPGRELTDYELAVVEQMKTFKAKYRIAAVAILKGSAAASMGPALERAGLPVQYPTEVEYAQACGDLFEAVVDTGAVVHFDQKSMNTAVAGGRKRELPEGGWRWARDAAADPGPIVVGTLARWARRKFPAIPRSKVW